MPLEDLFGHAIEILAENTDHLRRAIVFRVARKTFQVAEQYRQHLFLTTQLELAGFLEHFFDYQRAWPLIEEISRAAWNYFSPESPMTSRRTDLPVTAQQCEGIFLPPSMEETDLNDIDGWKQ